MDVSMIAAIVVIAVNIGGWGFTIGNLNGRVKSLEQTTTRHEGVISGDGLSKEISECKVRMAGLESEVHTYIELTRNEKKRRKKNV